MKICYEPKNFHRQSLNLLIVIDRIVNDYEEKGYSLTLRQVYYQLVSMDLIENSEKSYRKIGNLVKNGRLAGILDMEAIEDRTRKQRALNHFDGITDILQAAYDSYRRDLWEDQKSYVEIWVEKDALIGIVEKAAYSLDCPCFSCRGFPSITALWKAAERMKNKPSPIIYYLGDFDPTGLEIDKEIRSRLDQFGTPVHIERIGLTLDQVKKYDLPPNTAKESDTNYEKYKALYGEFSWELDALQPEIIHSLIVDHIKITLDPEKYNAMIDKQENERQKIYEFLETA